MIIPIIIAAIVLGKGFDYDTMTDKNVYIFDTTSIKENLQVIPRTFTQAQYRLMEYSSEVNDFLDISGDLSLKAKKGQIGLKGYGEYMMKQIDREKTVEILITVNHETVTETFPSYTDLRTDWQTKDVELVGTHYIRSITYGGQLMITYLLKANSTEYMQEIKAAVTANLAISGSLDASLKGNIDKLNKAIGDKTSVEIRAFATAGVFSPPQNLEQVFKLVEDYPRLVSQIQHGKGAPLKMEIISLSTVAPNFKEYRKNLALEALLNDATNKYDDVRISFKNFQSWASKGFFNKTETDMIDAYFSIIHNAQKEFQSAITLLKGDGGLDQFDKAFKAYGEGPNNIPNRFARDLLKLQHTIDQTHIMWFPYTKAVSHYIHWGSVNCTLPSPQPVYVGVAATSPKGTGNGGTVECLSVIPSPGLEDKELTEGTTISNINGMTYKLPDESTGPVLCSFCRLENATSVVTIHGRTSCPEETKLEYSGILMTSSDSGITSEFVCMDEVPDTHLPDVIIGTDEDAASLEPVRIEECDKVGKNKFIACVVCSR